MDAQDKAECRRLARQMLDDIWPETITEFKSSDIPPGAISDDLRSAARESLMDWCIGEGFLIPSTHRPWPRRLHDACSKFCHVLKGMIYRIFWSRNLTGPKPFHHDID